MAGAAIFLLAVISGIVQLAEAGCDGIPVSLSHRSSSNTVKSPNFPNDEKGHKANCIWDISPPRDGKRYFLKFEITQMSLNYLNKEKERICPGSYNLTVYGNQLDCSLDVNDVLGTSIPCMVYYDSPACERAAERECSESTANKTPFPVRVTYVSDGRSNFDGPIGGFRVRYEFKECPKEQEPSTTMTSTSVSASSVPELDQRETTIKDGGFSLTSSIAKGNPTTTFSTTAAAENKWSTAPEVEHEKPTGQFESTNGQAFPRTTVIAAAVGGTLLLVIIFVIIFFIRNRRQKSNNGGEAMTASERTSQSAGEGSSNPTNPLEEPGYATIGLDAVTNQSADDMYSTVHTPQTTAQPATSSGSHVTNLDQSDEIAYSAISIGKEKGVKETVRYTRNVVDNVLYGTT